MEGGFTLRPAIQPRPQPSGDPAISHPDLLLKLRSTRDRIYQTGTLPDAAGTALPVWPSGVTRERGEALRDLALSSRACTCLETGMGYGMSASFLLDAAMQSRSRLGGDLPASERDRPLVTSMDPGEQTLWNNAGLVHLEHAGAKPMHRFFAEESQNVLPKLLAAGERFDLGFVDGDHRFDGTFVDVYFLLRLVRPTGLIVLDDAWMPAVRKCSAFFVSNGLCERVSVWPSEDKQRLIALRPRAAHNDRVWDHFVDF